LNDDEKDCGERRKAKKMERGLVGGML